MKEKKHNRSSNKGNLKLRPTSGSEQTQIIEIRKGGTGLSGKISQSPCNNACIPMDVELGSKRKFEGVNRDVDEMQTQEKKKRMVDDNDYAEAAEVARQPCQDQ